MGYLVSKDFSLLLLGLSGSHITYLGVFIHTGVYTIRLALALRLPNNYTMLQSEVYIIDISVKLSISTWVSALNSNPIRPNFLLNFIGLNDFFILLN